jgi:hypothetical protein
VSHTRYTPRDFVKQSHLVGVFVLLCLVAAAAEAQTVTLRYRWAKGESRTYRMRTQTDSAVSGMPGAGPMSISQTMTQVLKFAAEDVAPDGTITLRQTFESVRMETNSPMGRMVVDTSVPDTNPSPVAQAMRQVLGAMVGGSVRIVMAPDGAIRKVEGASRIADKIAQVVSADPSAGAAGQGLKTMLSDDALKNTLEQTFPRLAAGPVKPGDTWTGQLAMGSPVIGRIAGTSTFTLKTLEGPADAPVARISVGLTLKQDVVPPPSGPSGMVMKLAGGRGEGELLFDVGKGHIQRGTMRTELPSTVTMTGPDGAPAMMQNKTTTTMTMERVDK